MLRSKPSITVRTRSKSVIDPSAQDGFVGEMAWFSRSAGSFRLLKSV
jgi:hypothetical protein